MLWIKEEMTLKSNNSSAVRIQLIFTVSLKSLRVDVWSVFLHCLLLLSSPHPLTHSLTYTWFIDFRSVYLRHRKGARRDKSVCVRQKQQQRKKKDKMETSQTNKRHGWVRGTKSFKKAEHESLQIEFEYMREEVCVWVCVWSKEEITVIISVVSKQTQLLLILLKYQQRTNFVSKNITI